MKLLIASAKSLLIASAKNAIAYSLRQKLLIATAKWKASIEYLLFAISLKLPVLSAKVREG